MKRYLAVKFESSSRRYTYEFPNVWKIRKGQYVTVATPREGIKAVKVAEVYPEDHVPSKSMEYKMIHGWVKAVNAEQPIKKKEQML